MQIHQDDNLATAGDHGAAEMSTPRRSPSSISASAVRPASQTALALLDIVQGAHTFRLWGLLGWHDIRRRYRRSKLGPFWLTTSMGILVGTLGVLFSSLFKIETADYVPYLALGFILWAWISSLVTDGCTVFINAESTIKQVSLPFSVHVYRMVWRNLIIFAHNAAIFGVVTILFSIRPGWVALLALPGFAFLILNGIWVGLLLGLVSVRFRDVPPVVDSVMRIAFFVTPIVWMPHLMPNRVALLNLNPFFHFLELVRAPLLGQVPDPVSWFVVSGITLCGWLGTFALFRLYRWRIAYWV